MKKNGFTLIELLSVLIILSILIMISFPIVLNAIKRTKSSLDSSVSAILLSSVNTCVSDGNCCQGVKLSEGKSCNVSVKYLIEKNYVTEGMLGNVTDTTTLVINESDGKLTISNTKDISSTIACNPSEGVSGKPTYSVDNSDAGVLPQKNLSDQTINFKAGTEYKCDPGDGRTRTFYVISTNSENNTVDLISATNYGGNVVETSANATAASATAYLNSLRSAWVNADDVRIPTSADITADTYFRVNLNCPVGSCTEGVVDLPGTTTVNIYDGVNIIGTKASTTLGYWTSSSSTLDYTVVNSAGTAKVNVNNADDYGFRPIITVRKIRFYNVANQW